MQTDQSICLSLEYSMTVKLLTDHHLMRNAGNGPLWVDFYIFSF